MIVESDVVTTPEGSEVVLDVLPGGLLHTLQEDGSMHVIESNSVIETEHSVDDYLLGRME